MLFLLYYWHPYIKDLKENMSISLGQHTNPDVFFPQVFFDDVNGCHGNLTFSITFLEDH